MHGILGNRFTCAEANKSELICERIWPSSQSGFFGDTNLSFFLVTKFVVFLFEEEGIFCIVTCRRRICAFAFWLFSAGNFIQFQLCFCCFLPEKKLCSRHLVKYNNSNGHIASKMLGHTMGEL